MAALNTMERTRLWRGCVGLARALEQGSHPQGLRLWGSTSSIIVCNLGITVLNWSNVLEPWGSQQEVSLKHV